MFVHDKPDLKALGDLVRERREALGLTQVQLAQRLGWAQERVSLLEHGKYGLPSLPNLGRLTDALNISLADALHALGYTDDMLGLVEQTRAQPGVAEVYLYTIQKLLAIEAASLKDALDQASDVIAEALGADKIDGFLYDASIGSLVALGTSHTPMGIRQHQIGLDRLPLANGGRMVEVYRSGEPFQTGRLDEDPGELPGMKEGLGVRSQLIVPLVINGQRRGVLATASAKPDRFSGADFAFLSSVAQWVGLLAHRAELVQTVTRDAAERARQETAEDLITLLAHDLGNHLTPLRGHIELLRRRSIAEERSRDTASADAALGALGRVQGMISDLLDATRLEQGLYSPALQPVELVAVVHDVANEHQASDVPIWLRLPEELYVQADRRMICQAVENLVANAVRYSSSGMPVTVELQQEHRDKGSFAVLSVRDEGPGISAELLPRIFQRFVKGSGSPGLGLGLYMAHRIAHAHGGTLTVESVAGEGATFHLTLPASGPTA